MSETSPQKQLPIHPSEEHLRKQAKRRMKLNPSLKLAEAQHQVAREYGCKHWAELMHVVETMNRGADQSVSMTYEMEALPKAANANDLARVREILQSGEFTQHDLDLAFARAVLRFSERQAIAKILLEHGANPNGQYGSNYGPIVFVTGEALDPDGLQFLIDAGADVNFAPIETKYGRQCPLSYFLGSYVRGRNAAKHRGIEILLSHSAHVPLEVTPAQLAIHRGDHASLSRMLDQDPGLTTRTFADMPFGNVSLHGATLLHAAVEFDEIDCCMELLNRGADVNDGSGGKTPVLHAVNNARIEMTQKLLQAGARLDAADQNGNTPLWYLCKSWAVNADRIAVAKYIIEYGAAVRRACENQSTALHQAASHGPIKMVELLLRNGAKEWQADKDGKLPIDYARTGSATDKDAIIELLDRPVIRDPVFKRAVLAIQTGDLRLLQTLLCEHPNLVHDRATEPDCYPPSYFSNPRLIWFVANNPTLMLKMPGNIVELAEAILRAGAPKEDLTYTLSLVMTSTPAQQQKLQLPLMELLLKHGAEAGDLLVVLAHRELEPIHFLIANGVPVNAYIAASLGRTDVLPAFLKEADAVEKPVALGLAVINQQLAAARLCIEAGASVNEFLPIHAHSLPTHQAAVNDDVEMLQLLVNHGGRLDIRDKLWNSTPLGWATFTGKKLAEAYLRSIGAPA